MKTSKLFKTSALSAALFASVNANADQQILDDLIVTFSACVGNDCVNGENFGFDTLRLKENNLRLHFQDTSNSASFPSNDWRIVANDSSNGGANYLAIEDSTAGRIPFRVEAGAPANTLYVEADGDIGIKTANPAVDLHIVEGNTPTLRLEQDGSDGFTAQTWDVAGNETSFFVRDATNGSKLPFRIQPGASNASIYIASDGDVGFETTTPDGQFDVAHSADANNHAFLIDPSSNVGVNIDNGFTPNGIFDVQTTGGDSKLTVTSTGRVGIGTSTPKSYYTVPSSIDVVSIAGQHALLSIDSGAATTTSSVALSSGGNEKWLLSSRNNLTTGGADAERFSIYNGSAEELLTIHQNGNMYFGDSPGSNNNTTHPIDTATGAHLTSGGVWTNASSRDLKFDVSEISYKAALEVLKNLKPVTYKYKLEPSEVYAGFIAEDVPDLVATSDRKSLSPMDIVAVLAKAFQAQQIEIETLKKKLNSNH